MVIWAEMFLKKLHSNLLHTSSTTERVTFRIRI